SGSVWNRLGLLAESVTVHQVVEIRHFWMRRVDCQNGGAPGKRAGGLREVSEGVGKRTFLNPWYSGASGEKVRFPDCAPRRNEPRGAKRTAPRVAPSPLSRIARRMAWPLLSSFQRGGNGYQGGLSQTDSLPTFFLVTRS